MPSDPQLSDPAPPAAQAPPPSQTQLAAFLSFIRDYKELLLLVAGLVTGTFFVLDYFATKSEVKIHRCQLQAQMDRGKAERDIEHLSKLIVDAKMELENKGLPRLR